MIDLDNVEHTNPRRYFRGADYAPGEKYPPGLNVGCVLASIAFDRYIKALSRRTAESRKRREEHASR